MKKPAKRISDLVSPRQQRNWDWRAAANFIAGGAGGGLLLFNALVSVEPGLIRAAILLGLMLIGGGLTCVWFEIGRPWRALNVYRHFGTSWMTREAFVALVLFPVGALALLTLQPLLVMLSGILGLAFLYSQARILAANKGIPAWRQSAQHCPDDCYRPGRGRRFPGLRGGVRHDADRSRGAGLSWSS
jgi:phenylacetyl-CoA:acceptor oxidoreductase subunit 2